MFHPGYEFFGKRLAVAEGLFEEAQWLAEPIPGCGLDFHLTADFFIVDPPNRRSPVAAALRPMPYFLTPELDARITKGSIFTQAAVSIHELDMLSVGEIELHAFARRLEPTRFIETKGFRQSLVGGGPNQPTLAPSPVRGEGSP